MKTTQKRKSLGHFLKFITLNHCGGVYELEKLSLFLRIKESIQSERLRSFQTIYDNCFINEME